MNLGVGAELTSIVLPVHNQADHIRNVVAGYRDALRQVAGSRELVLVPNGSTDDSVAVCRALEAEFGDIRVVALESGGWGRAVRAGIAASAGDRICYTNTARTTPEMLALLLLYSDAYRGVVVKANRRIRDTIYRRLGSLLYNLECRALFDLAVWDINGTPKVFPRSFEGLLELQRDDDLIDLEFNVVCRRRNYPVIEVPLLETVRHGGRSTTNVNSAIAMYRGAWQMSREIGVDGS